MEEVELVEGSGWISDESSFYGDVEDDAAGRSGSSSESFFLESTELQVKHHADIITNVAATAHKAQARQRTSRPPVQSSPVVPSLLRAAPAPCASTAANDVTDAVDSADGIRRTNDATADPMPDAHNPYEGRNSSYQFHETVDEFLKRLPVSSCIEDVGDFFIWIANPSGRPPREDSDIEGLVDEGTDLLDSFMAQKDAIEKKHAGTAQATITRYLTPLREQLKTDIEALAIRKHVKSGKWMLFPSEDVLPRTWRLIAEAVADNRLGTAAKVATVTDDHQKDGRLICVYTRDFSDTEDVRRVLVELVDLGLVDRDSTRGIYYKTDAYTHLEIESGNEYGLKASTYWSRTVLMPAVKKPGKSQATDQGSRKKQRTLENMFQRGNPK